MGVAFQPSETLARGDLDIFLTNAQGNPANAAEIYFTLYYVDPGPPETEVLIGPAQRTPVNPQVGEYYASLMVPPSATPGTYRIKWTFKEFLTSPYQQVAQEFAVVTTSAVITPGYNTAQVAMIRSLRILLRDQNPDKFYHFRPPEHEGDIGQYNRIFGQIWEDEELLEYLQRSLDWFNMFPPNTAHNILNLTMLIQQRPDWRTAILWGAIVHACFALSLNWVADEFDYSIGGVSLSIEKSSKYESLKQNAESQSTLATEAKARTVKYIRGLQQPRYGLGVRSAFGPYVGKGVLSPRNFIVWASALLSGTIMAEVLCHVSNVSSMFA